MIVRRAFLIAASFFFPVLVSAADAQWQISHLEPLATHQKGEARWAEGVQREAQVCKASGMRGPDAPENCERMRVYLLNQSARAIQWVGTPLRSLGPNAGQLSG